MASRRRACVELVPVGVVRSPFATILDAPRQGHLTEALSRIEVYERFAPALGAIGLAREDAPPGAERLLVVTWAHLADRTHLARVDGTGAFEGRSPHRPNPILVTEVEVLAREGNVLVVRGLDMVDGTPVLDLKPAHAEHEGPMPFLRATAEAAGRGDARF